MPLDPRFDTLLDHLNAARIASFAGDDQLMTEHLYHLREIAWDINSDIFAKRWQAHELQIAKSRRIPAPPVTVDDLMET